METIRLFKRKAAVLLCITIVLSCLSCFGAVASAAEGDGTCDLVVTAITTEPANPKPGDQVTFCATIKNQGTGASPSGVIHGVRFSVGELEAQEFTWNDAHTDSIPANGSVTLKATGGTNSSTWTATEGTHKVYAWVDDQNRINESNADNNVFSTDITVSSQQSGGNTPKPSTGDMDIEVTEVSAKAASVYDGDYVNLYATVRNSGGKDAVNPSIIFLADNKTIQTVTYNGTIAAGQQKSVVTTAYWHPSFGSHKLKAKADPNNTLKDVNTSNNTQVKRVSVIDDTNPNPPATTKETPTQPTTKPVDPPTPGNGEVITYPEQAGLSKASGYSMKVNGKAVSMFKTRCNLQRKWNPDPATTTVPVGMFDFRNGAVTVEITFPENVSNVVVRPTDKGVKATTSGNTVKFTVSKAGQFSVEPNGDQTKAVLVFANPYEDKPSGNVRVIEGLVTDNIRMSGNTLYIAPGATFRGRIVFNNTNGTVCGRGVVDGSHLKSFKLGESVHLQIETWASSNVTISGVALLDGNAWICQIQNTSNVTIDNVKIVSARSNSDGISIQSSDNVKIRNSFIRSWDDSIVVKNYAADRYSHDITAENCVIWTDLAQSIELGFETNKGRGSNPYIKGCTFKDMYIIHANHKAPISIHNADNANISDINFLNIYIDDCQSGQGDGWRLIVDITNLRPGGSFSGTDGGWMSVSERGNISKVTIDGLYVRSSSNQGMRIDSSDGGSITGVTIKNYYRGNQKITNANDAGASIKSANVSFQ